MACSTSCLTATETDRLRSVSEGSAEKGLTWKDKVDDLNFHCYSLIYRGELTKCTETIVSLEAQIFRGNTDRQTKFEGLTADIRAEYLGKVAQWSFNSGVLSAPVEFYRPDLVDLSPALQESIKTKPTLITALKCHFAVVGLQNELRLKNVQKTRIEAHLATLDRHMKDRSHFELGLKAHSERVVREFISDQYETSPEYFVKIEEKVSGATELPGLIRSRLASGSETASAASSTRVYYGETRRAEAWYAVRSLENPLAVDYFVERPDSWHCWDHAQDLDGKARILTLLEFSRTEATRKPYPLLPSLMVPPRRA